MQCVYYRGDSAHFLLRGQQIMGVVFPSAYLSAGPRDRRHTRPTACETDDMRDRWHAGPTACETDDKRVQDHVGPRPREPTLITCQSRGASHNEKFTRPTLPVS